MQALNRINKNVLVGAMIAASGLCTSLAWAQFQVEHTAVVEVETSSDLVDHEESVVIIQISDGEQVVDVRLVNGEVSVVKVDDEVLGEDHYFVRGDELLIKDDDGEVIREIKLPRIQSDIQSDIQSNISDGVAEHVYEAVATDTVDDDGFFGQLQEHTYKPKVMLGINLGEPSKVLRKHLNLKDGMHAILVEGVIDGLPADKAGLEDFDVIVSIDGSDQADGQLLSKVLSEKDAGDMMKLVVLRGGEKMKIKVKLAAYDAQALGTVSELKAISPADNQEIDFEYKFLNKLGDDVFPGLDKDELERLKMELHKVFTESKEQREMGYVIRAKAMDAMKEAERQMIELRDGKLVVRSKADLDRHVEHLKGRVHETGEKLHQEMAAPHVQDLNHRLGALEARLDDQMTQMSEQMDRLADMFERLMDRLDAEDD